MKIKKEYIVSLIAVVGFYFMFSVVFSIIQRSEKACNKTYPINYIFYSKLFCEIKGDK